MTKEQKNELIKLIEQVKKENENFEVALMGSALVLEGMGITEECWGGARIVTVGSQYLPASDCIYVMPMNKLVNLQVGMEEYTMPIQLLPDTSPVIAPVQIVFEEENNEE